MSRDDTSTVQCPKCESIFRVQPQHLETAKGWLQCGVCGNVFHTATPSTAPEPEVEETEPAAPPPVPIEQAAESGVAISIASTQTEPPPTETPATATVESTEAPVQTTESEADISGPPALTGLAQRMAEQEAETPFGPKLESIILVDPDIPAGELGPLPTFAADDKTTETPKVQPASAGQSSPIGAGWTPRQSPVNVARKKKKHLWIWLLLAVLLTLGLVAQLVYFMRNDLAVQYPQLRPYLVKLCSELNCQLSLPRDNKLVLILGSDLQTESPGSLALAVTLANRADHAMAWPVLELTLTDVKDQPVGRRVFAPSEYLPSPELEAAGIQPLSEVPLTLKLQIKGVKAMGYRLQMFY